MTWKPGRRQPHHHQPGNPMPGGQPGLKHPPQNESGMLPGTPRIPRGPEAWSGTQHQQFASDGTNQVWTWNTPVFDLHPGLSAAYGQIPDAVPINHDASYGLSAYLSLVVGESTGTTPPALTVGWTAEYWEVGNTNRADNGNLLTLTPIQDVTSTLTSGGVAVAAPFGASIFNFTPCSPGLRFWQLHFRLTQPGVAAVTLPYFIQAAIH